MSGRGKGEGEGEGKEEREREKGREGRRRKGEKKGDRMSYLSCYPSDRVSQLAWSSVIILSCYPWALSTRDPTVYVALASELQVNCHCVWLFYMVSRGGTHVFTFALQAFY